MRSAASLLLMVLFSIATNAEAEGDTQPGSQVEAPLLQAPASAPDQSSPPQRSEIGPFTHAYWGMSKTELRTAYPNRQFEQVCDEKGIECLESTAWQIASDRIMFLFARDKLYRIEICPKLDELELSCRPGEIEDLVTSATQHLKTPPVFLPKIAEVDILGQVQRFHYYSWGNKDSRFVLRVNSFNKSTTLVYFNPSLQLMAEKMELAPWDCASFRRSHMVEAPPRCGKKRPRR